MDVGLELEETIESNFTNSTNSTLDYYAYEGLHLQQICFLFFTLICLAPNAFILYVIWRNKLSSTTYWTIANWSIMNSTFLLTLLPLCVIPVKYMAGSLVADFCVYFGITLATFTCVLVMLLLCDFFIQSEQIAKRLTITTWSLIILSDAFYVTFELTTNTSHIFQFGLQIVFLLTSAIFFTKWLYSCFTRTSVDCNFRLRIRLSGVYIVTWLVFWCSEFLVFMQHFHLILLVIAAIIMVYLNGYFNLILLICYDSRMKRCCMQLFRGSNRYSDIRYDARDSVVKLVEDQNG